MRLLEFLELIQRCINVNAAGSNSLTLLVNGRGGGILDDGGFFRRLPRARRFPKAKDHGETGLQPFYVLGFKSFVSFPLLWVNDVSIRRQLMSRKRAESELGSSSFMYFVATAHIENPIPWAHFKSELQVGYLISDWGSFL
jgi:hypothetical protein